jgi:hypothetical protein
MDNLLDTELLPAVAELLVEAKSFEEPSYLEAHELAQEAVDLDLIPEEAFYDQVEAIFEEAREKKKELWAGLYEVARQYLPPRSKAMKELQAEYDALKEAQVKLKEKHDRMIEIQKIFDSEFNEKDVVAYWETQLPVKRYERKVSVKLEDDMCGMFDDDSVETVPLEYYEEAEEGHWRIKDTVGDIADNGIDVRYSRIPKRGVDDYWQAGLSDDRVVDNGFLSDQDHRSCDITGYGY